MTEEHLATRIDEILDTVPRTEQTLELKMLMQSYALTCMKEMR